jgi:hypothetical protein
VPNDRPPIPSDVAGPLVGADACCPIQVTSRRGSGEPRSRCCPAVSRASIARSAATPVPLSGDSIHRIHSVLGCAILPALSGHVSRTVVEAIAKWVHSRAGLSIGLMDTGADGIRSTLVGRAAE